MTRPRHDAAPVRRLPPVLILLLGLLTTVVCLLLLFAPLFAPSPPPGVLTQSWMVQMLDSRGPFVLEDWLRHRFFLMVLVLLVVVLAVLPWRAARTARSRGRRGGAASTPDGTSSTADGTATHGFGGTRATGAARRSALTFSDDGRILDPEHPGAETIARSVPELQALARTAGIPWHADFGTEGGARGLLEIVRAAGTGPVGVRRAPADPGGGPAR